MQSLFALCRENVKMIRRCPLLLETGRNGGTIYISVVATYGVPHNALTPDMRVINQI